MALDVPLLRQEHAWTCLPACIRMVLAYRGRLFEEAEIAAACGTVPLRGTQLNNCYTVARESFLTAWQALDAQGMVVWL